MGALLAGGVVSASLLVASDPERQLIEVYAAASDIPRGAVISNDVLRPARIMFDDSGQLFTPAENSVLAAMRAVHDLNAGQLIQRTDVTDAGATTDRRSVFVAIKNAPPAGPGARVDLLLIRGGADRTSVVPFALGVEVRSVVTGGLIVVVPARQASAFVYASATMELVAVIAEPGATDGEEVAVSSPDEAIAVASP